MIIVYTFDFKKNTKLDDRKHQFMMLLLSIQSVIDTKRGMRIVVYTNDNLVKKKLHTNFGEEIEIILGDSKTSVCDTSWFTCAGHSRLDLLLKFVAERHGGGVLYMDYDTIVHPELFDNIGKFKRPTLYRVETWHDLKMWTFLHTKSVELYHYIDKTILPRYNYKADLDVINNGVIYLPPTRESEDWIKLANDIYRELMTNVGYSYGLDQTSMSIVCHIMKTTDMFFTNGSTNKTIWHAYCVKEKYRETIERSIIKLDDNFEFINRYVDVYNLLFTTTTRPQNKSYSQVYYKTPFSKKNLKVATTRI